MMNSMNSTKSAATTGSESGSSNGSCGDLSPSETPTPTQLSLPLHNSVDAGMGMITTVLPTGLGNYQPKPHHFSYKQQQQQMNLQQRLNGRNGMDKTYQQVYTTGTPSIVSDAQTISSASLQQQQPQTLLISQSPVSTPTTTVLLQPQQPPPTTYNTSYPYHQRGPRRHSRRYSKRIVRRLPRRCVVASVIRWVRHTTVSLFTRPSTPAWPSCQ